MLIAIKFIPPDVTYYLPWTSSRLKVPSLSILCHLFSEKVFLTNINQNTYSLRIKSKDDRS